MCVGGLCEKKIAWGLVDSLCRAEVCKTAHGIKDGVAVAMMCHRGAPNKPHIAEMGVELCGCKIK